MLEILKMNRADYTENDMGEDIVLHKLVVMDDVSGLADSDRRREFPNFLTVSQKYRITCFYIFHTVYPTRDNWQLIMSQTKIFNFFPGFIHFGSMIRVLASFVNRYKNSYVPQRTFLMNK